MSKPEVPTVSRLVTCGLGEIEDRRALGRAAILNALLFAVTLIFVTPYFEIQDDLYMQMIASGFYTGHPSEYLVFTHFLIGWSLRLLYGLWDGCNWYLVYLLAVHYAAYTAIAFLVLKRRYKWPFVLLYSGFFLLVEIRLLLHLQFTTTAFLAGTAGVLLIADGLRPGRRVHWGTTLTGVAFVALTGMIREQVVPFAALVALPFLVEHFAFRGWRRAALAGMACVSLFLMLLGVNRWYYLRDPAWAQFGEYNKLRALFQDTPLRQLIPAAAPSVGWSQNDCWMLEHYFYSDPEVFGSVPKMRLFTATLKELTRSGSASEDFSLKPFFSLKFFGEDSRLLLAFAILNIAWFLVFAGPRWPRYLITLVAFYALYVGLSCYLIRTAKFPERVAYCLPLMLHAVCLYWLVNLETQPPDRPRNLWHAAHSRWLTRRVGLGLLVVWACSYLALVWILVGHWSQENRFKSSLRARRDRILDPIRPLAAAGQKPILIFMACDTPNWLLEGCLFFYSSPNRVPFSVVPYSWVAHSPLFHQALDRHQLEPFSLSLATRDDVFFVTEPRWIEPLQIFYKEHFGLDVCLDLAVDVNKWTADGGGIFLRLYQARVIGSSTSAALSAVQ